MAFLHLGWALPIPVTIIRLPNYHSLTSIYWHGCFFFPGTRAAVGSATRAALEALIHLGGGDRGSQEARGERPGGSQLYPTILHNSAANILQFSIV